MRAVIIAVFVLCTNVLLAQTVISGSFMHNGIMRDYRLYIPAIYDPATPVPLLFNLHGYGIENTAQEIYSDFRPIADTANFIIVHPNGTVDDQGYRFWNVFGIPTIDDGGFLTALIDTITADLSIDEDRIYSTGMSNGGMMSYELACFHGERIAAIASVTGSMLASRLNACSPVHPTPVLQIHGTSDVVVPFNGGNGWVSVQQLLDHWISFNDCDPLPEVIDIVDSAPLDGSTVEHHIYDCTDGIGTTVELIKVIDGGHTWPGSVVQLVGTNYDIDASIEVWRFLSRYSLSDLSTPIIDTDAINTLTIAPNPSAEHFDLRFDRSRDRTITVTNALGQQLFQVRSSDMDVRLQVERPGAYVITVSEGESPIIKRVIKL